MTGQTLSGIDPRQTRPNKENQMSTVTMRLVGLAAALTLSACSGEKPSGQSGANVTDAAANASATHDMAGTAIPSTGDPDTDFLRGMIPHHEGAVEMARAEIANGTDPKVRAMAEEVIRTQQAEIEKMQTWLAERQAAKKGTR